MAADAPPRHEVLDRPHGRVRSRRPAPGIDYSASLRIHVFFVSQYGEPVEGRGRAVEARYVRVDRVPGLGLVDTGPRLAGIRGRSQRKGQALTSELGTDHFDPIPVEPNLVLHAGDDHALEPGERRRTPVSSVGAAVAPRRRHTTNVPLGAFVVRRHRRVIQEGEQVSQCLYSRFQIRTQSGCRDRVLSIRSSNRSISRR